MPRGESGQAAVELAVCMPVMLAVSIIGVDALVYLGDCARFDRVAAQEVAVIASAPSAGSYSAAASADHVRAAIQEGMGGAPRLTIDVAVEQGAPASDDAPGFSIGSFAPQLCTYTCTMRSTPWPLSKGAFGADVSILMHARSYVVDPYRPGVVV